MNLIIFFISIVGIVFFFRKGKCQSKEVFIDMDFIFCCPNGTQTSPYPNFSQALQNNNIASILIVIVSYNEKPYELSQDLLYNNITIKILSLS